MATRRDLDLFELLSLPTAPFRENVVTAFVCRVLQRHHVPYFSDPAGNMVVGCGSRLEYQQLLRKKSTEPVRLFVAHMDHPGFHGERWLAPDRLSVRWHGGSPVRHLHGSRVWLADDTGYVDQGRLVRAQLHRHGHSINVAEVQFSRPMAPKHSAQHLYGGFGFRAPVWSRGRRLYTKAADDLVGVHVILETAIAHFSRRARRPPVPFLALLTRGEEVGFIGAMAHFELGWWRGARRPMLCVSLETSRTLPGAEIGKGPVVRLGDRRTVFSADALRIISELAEHKLPERHQRRIMDGGTCEATAALAFGIPAIGISVPLGNYHNEGFDETWLGTGGQRSARKTRSGNRGPAPEFVHRDDIDGMRILCGALLEPGLGWGDPWKPVRGRLQRNFRKYRSQLRSAATRRTKR